MAMLFGRTALAAGPALALAAALAIGAAGAWAQDSTPAAEEDPVVATVNGTPILRSEVLAEIQNLPPQYRQVPPPVLIPAIAEQMAAGVLIRDAAYDEGLADDPEVEERLQHAERRIVQDVWLERRIAERMTDEALDQAYQAYLDEHPPVEEVSARHILVETEDEAREIIGQLDEGADFAELAQEHSIGPSSADGGNLGYFRRDQMVEPFAEAAFALEPGAYTEDPVETQFGWHVIMVDETRMSTPPTLDEVRDELTQNLRQTFVRDILDGLMAEAEIVLYGPDGEPLAPPADEAAPEETGDEDAMAPSDHESDDSDHDSDHDSGGEHEEESEGEGGTQ